MTCLYCWVQTWRTCSQLLYSGCHARNESVPPSGVCFGRTSVRWIKSRRSVYPGQSQMTSSAWVRQSACSFVSRQICFLWGQFAILSATNQMYHGYHGNMWWSGVEFEYKLMWDCRASTHVRDRLAPLAVTDGCSFDDAWCNKPKHWSAQDTHPVKTSVMWTVLALCLRERYLLHDIRREPRHGNVIMSSRHSDLRKRKHGRIVW